MIFTKNKKRLIAIVLTTIINIIIQSQPPSLTFQAARKIVQESRTNRSKIIQLSQDLQYRVNVLQHEIDQSNKNKLDETLNNYIKASDQSEEKCQLIIDLDAALDHYSILSLILEKIALCKTEDINKKLMRLFQKLLNYSDINKQESYGLATVLHNAIAYDNIEAVNQLLAKPTININAQDFLKATPLMKAIDRNRTHMVKQLLDAGADVTIKDMYGKTAFDYAQGCLVDNEIKKIIRDYHQ